MIRLFSSARSEKTPVRKRRKPYGGVFFDVLQARFEKPLKSGKGALALFPLLAVDLPQTVRDKRLRGRSACHPRGDSYFSLCRAPRSRAKGTARSRRCCFLPPCCTSDPRTRSFARSSESATRRRPMPLGCRCTGQPAHLPQKRPQSPFARRTSPPPVPRSAAGVSPGKQSTFSTIPFHSAVIAGRALSAYGRKKISPWRCM